MKARINKKEYREEIKGMSKDELLELKVVLMNRQKQIKNLGARDEGLEQKMKVIDKLVGNVTIDKETAELVSRG
jgi:hypothetical protein